MVEKERCATACVTAERMFKTSSAYGFFSTNGVIRFLIRDRVEYYVTLDAEFILNVLRDFSNHLPAEPRSDGDELHPVISDMMPLATLMSRIQPNSCETLYIVAKLYFLSNELQKALSSCAESLKIDATFIKVIG